MKKRLSLLLAALMIITMLPMSAFAAAKPSVTVQTVKDTKNPVDVTVTLKFDQGQTVNMGDLKFTIENGKLAPIKDNKQEVIDGYGVAPEIIAGAETALDVAHDVAPKDNVSVAGAVDANSGNIGGTDTTPVIPSYEEFVLKVAKEKKAVSGKNLELSFKLKLNLDESQDGMVKLAVEDLGHFDGQKITPVGVGEIESFVIAKVDRSTKALTINAKTPDVEISYDGGEVSRFDVRNFDNAAAGVNADYLVLELDSDDYYAFDKSAKATKIYLDGVAAVLNTDFTWDKDGYRITFPQARLVGKQVITVVPSMERMGRSAGEGEIVVMASSLKVKAGETIGNTADPLGAEKDRDKVVVVESTSAKIGKVIDFKVTMTVKEKNKSEIPSLWGGETAVVTVTLKGPKGSFADRGIEFSVDGAGVIEVMKKSIKTKPVKTENADVSDGFISEGIYKDGKFTISAGKDIHDKMTELSFDMKIVTDHDKNGTATITAAQRAWETTADLAKVTPKFTVDTKATEVMKSQVNKVENIVITEAKQGLLRKGEKITLLFETTRDYIEFEKIAKVEATNGMELGKVKILTAAQAWSGSKGTKSFDKEHDKFNKAKSKYGVAYIAAEVEIKKPSKDGAAVITFSGVDVKVDGSTVDGVYKVKTGLNGHTVAAVDYVTTVKEYGLKPVSTVFTIGQTQYTVNGEAKTAASAPYVKNGRTMLPVRALAESLGLRVQWNAGTKTATFTDEAKVAAVVIGSEVIHVNGTPIKLNAKAEIVNGTTFIELRSLATAFGVQIDWDAAAKQATVSK